MKENKKVRNVLQKYMQWPVVLSALVLCANGAVGLVSGKAGMVMAVFTVLYAFCAGVLFWYGKKRILTGLVGFAADFDQSQKNLMASMELPYGIADEAGRLLWTNRAFSAVIRDEKSAGGALRSCSRRSQRKAWKKWTMPWRSSARMGEPFTGPL